MVDIWEHNLAIMPLLPTLCVCEKVDLVWYHRHDTGLNQALNVFVQIIGMVSRVLDSDCTHGDDESTIAVISKQSVET